MIPSIVTAGLEIPGYKVTQCLGVVRGKCAAPGAIAPRTVGPTISPPRISPVTFG